MIQVKTTIFQHLLSKIHSKLPVCLFHSSKSFIHFMKAPPLLYQMFGFLVPRKISLLIHLKAKFVHFEKYQEKCSQVQLLLPQSFVLPSLLLFPPK